MARVKHSHVNSDANRLISCRYNYFICGIPSPGPEQDWNHHSMTMRQGIASSLAPDPQRCSCLSLPCVYLPMRSPTTRTRLRIGGERPVRLPSVKGSIVPPQRRQRHPNAPGEMEFRCWHPLADQLKKSRTDESVNCPRIAGCIPLMVVA
jgi:hypothetical protein